MITTVTGKNQVTIPARIARMFGIQPGARLNWEIGEYGMLIVHTLPQRGQLARETAGMGKAWLSPGSDPVAKLIEERILDDEDAEPCDPRFAAIPGTLLSQIPLPEKS